MGGACLLASRACVRARIALLLVIHRVFAWGCFFYILFQTVVRFITLFVRTVAPKKNQGVLFRGHGHCYKEGSGGVADCLENELPGRFFSVFFSFLVIFW